MRLPKIYEHFSQGQIFTIDEAREKLQTTGNTLRKRLSELATRGYLQSIRQGLYRVASPDRNLNSLGQSSPFAVAAKVTPYCYIGFKSALQLHAEEIPVDRDTMYVVSPTKFNGFSFEGRYYFWCQSPDSFGLLQCRLSSEQNEFDVLVTDFEKTIVDCLRRPAHSPNFHELARLCGKIRVNPDLDKVLRYAERCDIAALFNRLGFFLEKMQMLWDVPPQVLYDVERRMSRKQTEWPIIEGATAHPQPVIIQNPGFLAPDILPQSTSGTLDNRWRIQLSRISGATQQG